MAAEAEVDDNYVRVRGGRRLRELCVAKLQARLRNFLTLWSIVKQKRTIQFQYRLAVLQLYFPVNDERASILEMVDSQTGSLTPSTCVYARQDVGQLCAKPLHLRGVVGLHAGEQLDRVRPHRVVQRQPSQPGQARERLNPHDTFRCKYSKFSSACQAEYP